MSEYTEYAKVEVLASLIELGMLKDHADWLLVNYPAVATQAQLGKKLISNVNLRWLTLNYSQGAEDQSLSSAGKLYAEIMRILRPDARLPRSTSEIARLLAKRSTINPPVLYDALQYLQYRGIVVEVPASEWSLYFNTKPHHSAKVYRAIDQTPENTPKS